MGAYAEAVKFLGFINTQAASTTPATDLPARQYITSGQAVYDCEQVSITNNALTTGLPAQTSPGAGSLGGCNLPTSLVIEAAIVRCQPGTDQKDGPTVQQLDDFAKVQSNDADILMAAAQAKADERFGNVIVTIAWPPPSGGMAATLARVTMTLSV